ncbi:MAG: cobalamin biosynthesis protein CobQ [Ruminococcus sp.]|nr:cobalamin biosynthesis protein CobQ [Ruminococcus sp.]MDE6784953.1 cobalamin biosynthesis protein CobQ [Ruminococcus sp.]
MKKITVITGHYGTGKTNFSVNLALNAARNGEKITVVDLDLVNPYFRTADFRELFAENSIELVAPDFANSNLDVPSVQFDLGYLAGQDRKLIIDVGGDDAGAFALGRFSDVLNSYGTELDMLYIINQRRNLTENSGDAAALMYEIETASRMKHTAIVNNTNLGCETTADIIMQSVGFAKEVSDKTGLPVACTTCREELCELLDIPDVFPVKVYVKPLWEL